MSFNKITIVGHLGKDPELRYTPQGSAVCSFSIATSEKRRDKAGEFQETTTWFRVTLWGKQAELASKYLSKGSLTYIEGRLRVEEWTDRDNQTRQSLEVNGSDMQFIGSNPNTNARSDDYAADDFSNSGAAANDPGESPRSGAAMAADNAAPAGDDDIPF